jgi:hypothetical protein
VDLTVLDIRGEELGLAGEWLRLAGLTGWVRLRTLRGDATRLPEYFEAGSFNLIIAWGSPLGHLDVWRLPLLVAGAREVQAPHGALVAEQWDTLPKVLVNNSFRRVLVEGDIPHTLQGIRYPTGCPEEASLQTARARVYWNCGGKVLGDSPGGGCNVDVLQGYRAA